MPKPAQRCSVALLVCLPSVCVAGAVSTRVALYGCCLWLVYGLPMAGLWWLHMAGACVNIEMYHMDDVFVSTLRCITALYVNPCG
jgi:hypothetical protein